MSTIVCADCQYLKTQSFAGTEDVECKHPALQMGDTLGIMQQLAVHLKIEHPLQIVMRDHQALPLRFSAHSVEQCSGHTTYVSK